MTSTATLSRQGTSFNQRAAGVIFGLVAEVLLLGALAFAAWGDPQDEAQPPLSFDDGIGGILIFGGVASVLVFGAAAAIVATRRWWGTVLATVQMAMAGIVGFLGFALVSLSRQETSDC